MRYDIGKREAPEMSSLGKGKNASDCCSHRPQKTCMAPHFDAFPFTWRTYQRRRISVS